MQHSFLSSPLGPLYEPLHLITVDTSTEGVSTGQDCAQQVHAAPSLHTKHISLDSLICDKTGGYVMVLGTTAPTPNAGVRTRMPCLTFQP
jgi:hypothetical protein